MSVNSTYPPIVSIAKSSHVTAVPPIKQRSHTYAPAYPAYRACRVVPSNSNSNWT